jgi:Protein of unknown function (DUF3112)
MSLHQPLNPPYLPRIAILGETPTKMFDIPISTAFLALFLVGAISNMIIFRCNKAKGHKFLPSFLLYIFCMARAMSCIMRIIWACHQDDARVAIAAVIFVSAGVLILFLVNIIFAQRILRSRQPQLGWHPKLSKIFKLLYVLIVLVLAMVVTVIIQSYFTLSPVTLRIDRDVQLGGMTYFLSLAVLPILIIYLSLVLPRRTKPERFGIGWSRTKLRGLLLAAILCTLGASFRTGTEFMPPRPKDDPAWYHGKLCFYLFNFTLEIIVVYLYLVLRVDQRFHVPNGSHGPGDYSRGKLHPEIGVGKENGSRNSFSSYARLITPSSSVYSQSIRSWHESEVSEVSEELEMTYTLPEIVHQSQISLRRLEDAPYIDVQFASQEEECEWWPSWPAAVVLRPFGL